MKPTDMTILHDPDNGYYGDCQRACIASLLEIDINEIPHFYETGNDSEFFKSLNRYLATQGLVHVETMPIDFKLSQYRNKGNLYHMIYGETVRGSQHAIVALNGEIIHDPHPDKAGLDKSKKDDWHYAFLVKMCDS